MNPRNFFELSEYTGRPLQAVMGRATYATAELAWQWPLQPDTLQFYRDAELYLFDLTMYHDLLDARGTHQWFKDTIQKYGFKDMLDYGGGCGDWTILAHEAGAQCAYLDVDGVMKKYARWRFERHRIDPLVLPETAELRTHDAIIIFDCLEHLTDPQSLIAKLAGCTEYIFCNPIEEIPFNELYPQHVSRYDLSPFFTQVDTYLWRRKNPSGPPVSSPAMKASTSDAPLNPSKSSESGEALSSL